MQKSERIKAEVSLREVVEATGIKWDKHKSNPQKGDWWGPCPLHGEDTPSFHVVEPGGTDGYFKCFGCHRGGSVIDFAMQLQGWDFTTAVRVLAKDAGIVGELSEDQKQALEDKRARAREEARKAADEKAAYGLQASLTMWTNADMSGALVAEYLTARGILLPAIGGLPLTIRQVDDLPHRNKKGNVVFRGAAMVAAIGRDKILGVHRTWITSTGRARHEDGRKVEKQWIGKTGEMMGKPVCLSPASQFCVVGEGIETTAKAFSGLLSHGQVGWSAEAALSRGAITGPASDESQLWVPRPGVEEVLILGEGSEKNPREARELYEGAKSRLLGLGLRAELRVPYGRWDLDLDFCDVPIFDA